MREASCDFRPADPQNKPDSGTMGRRGGAKQMCTVRLWTDRACQQAGCVLHHVHKAPCRKCTEHPAGIVPFFACPDQPHPTSTPLRSPCWSLVGLRLKVAPRSCVQPLITASCFSPPNTPHQPHPTSTPYRSPCWLPAGPWSSRGYKRGHLGFCFSPLFQPTSPALHPTLAPPWVHFIALTLLAPC